MASTNLTLKLHIDESSNKVRFAEASKDVVDFLFSLLLLPLGTVARFLTTEDRVGCLDKLMKLYESVGKFDQTYWQPGQGQDVLLKPGNPASSTVNLDHLMASIDNNAHHQSTNPANHPTSDPRPSSTTRPTGFVKGGVGVIYEVTDDLLIQPLPAPSGNTSHNPRSVGGGVYTKDVQLGSAERKKLLTAFLQSKPVLTSIFEEEIRAQRNETQTPEQATVPPRLYGF